MVFNQSISRTQLDQLSFKKAKSGEMLRWKGDVNAGRWRCGLTWGNQSSVGKKRGKNRERL